MKAILLIDMPSRCFNCPLHDVIDGDEENEFIVICNAENWRKSTTHMPVENLEERPSWCPLKPMPHSKQMENRWFSDDYSKGWNDLLKEIEE